MNLGEIITRIQVQFGDTSEAQITRDDIRRWVNDGQIDIVRKTNCLQGHSQTNSVKGDASYTVPEDFIKIRRVTYDGRALAPVTLEEIDKYRGDREANPSVGVPSIYYVWSERVWLHPAPDKNGVGNLDIFYIIAPTELVEDSDIPDIPSRFHEDLVRYGLARAKEVDEEDQKAQEVMADYEVRLGLGRDEVNNPYEHSYSSVRALPGDDW